LNLPPQIQVLERGWLSSNNILIDNGDGCTLIDSGYVAHAAQTLQLLQHALGGKLLVRLINTHCHSDHMGGNAAAQRTYGCRTSIPVGEAPAIGAWDDATLMLSYTGQSAERFSYDDTLAAGDRLQLSGLEWEARAAGVHAEFPGVVDQPRLPAAYAAADAFVLASFTEGHPKVLLEAMASGVPCVASDCAGNRSLVTDGATGLLFDARRPDELAGRLARVLTDDALAASLAKAARDLVVARYDLAALVAREIALLRAVARHGAPAGG